LAEPAKFAPQTSQKSLGFGLDKSDRVLPDYNGVGVTRGRGNNAETAIVNPFHYTFNFVACEEFEFDFLVFANNAMDVADAWQGDIQV
jgi:hypothetical protein